MWLLAPCPGLPLAAGTTWTYTATVTWTASGTATTRDTTLVWRTTVLDSRVAGTIRVATVRDWPTALAWWEPGKLSDTTIIVCRDNKVYHLGADQGPVPALVDSLLAGTRVPTRDDLMLQFPLITGELYGRERSEREDTFYAWYVESADVPGADLLKLGAARSDSVFTVAYRSLPDHQILGVIRGLGIVEYTFGHHGTVASAHARLEKFSPVP